MQESKTVLLTRSAEENFQLHKRLKKYRIFSTINCPLITFKELLLDHGILEHYSNIIITSKYAAKILTKIIKTPVKAFVVGNATASILKPPFTLEYVARDAKELMNVITQLLCHSRAGGDDTKTFLYLSSNEITVEFPSAVKRQIIYEAQYTKKLSPAQIKTISQGVDYILLYSHNCAKTLVELLIKYNLQTKLSNARIIAISLKVANAVKPYFKNVMFCRNDSLDSETFNDKIIELLITDAGIRK